MATDNPFYIIIPLSIMALAAIGIGYMDQTSKPYKGSSNAGTGIGHYLHYKGGKTKRKTRKL
jgi:hypothetical protein